MMANDFVKGGSFLLGKTEPQAVFTPEDYTDEHKMIAETTQDFVEGEIVPRDEEIEALDYDLTVKLLRKAGGPGATRCRHSGRIRRGRPR